MCSESQRHESADLWEVEVKVQGQKIGNSSTVIYLCLRLPTKVCVRTYIKMPEVSLLSKMASLEIKHDGCCEFENILIAIAHRG